MENNQKEDQYYTPQEIAILLKVSYMTVFRWITAGSLEAVKVGKQYRVKKTKLDQFINQSSNAK